LRPPATGDRQPAGGPRTRWYLWDQRSGQVRTQWYLFEMEIKIL